MTLLNNLIDNNYISYGLFATTAGFIGYLVINSYFTPTVINTPNSPPTFNFTLDQLKDIEIHSQQETHKNLILDQLDNEGEFDEIFKQILTEEEYKQYQAELLDADNDFSQNLQDIFDLF